MALIAGLGRAADLVTSELEATAAHMADLRERLQSTLLRGLPGDKGRVVIHGPRPFSDLSQRLPNTLSVSIRGVSASRLLGDLSDRLAASAGAACHSGGAAVSSVLAAMGVPAEVALSTLRLSVGRHTTREEVDRAAALIIEYVTNADGGGIPNGGGGSTS